MDTQRVDESQNIMEIRESLYGSNFNPSQGDYQDGEGSDGENDPQRKAKAEVDYFA